MEILYYMVNILEIIIYSLLLFSVAYMFLFSIGGLFYKEPKMGTPALGNKIAVIIPGYKEDAVIIETAKNALQQDYPSQNFDVVVVADSFKEETLKELKKLPIRLIEVFFDDSERTKSKAVNTAMEKLTDDYDMVVILDADNHMGENFLKLASTCYQGGNHVIQGHRAAKNMNTNFAVLDAFSEEINNHIFRKGHRALGFSAALIGSAMIFDYKLFKEYMGRIKKALGGEDKELEALLLRDKYKIKYLDSAYVYDEKVQKVSALKNQRSRWIFVQYFYLFRFFNESFVQLFKGNFDFFNKVIQGVLAPRLLLLGSLSFMLFFSLIMEILNRNWLYFSFAHWVVVFALAFFSFAFSIPKKMYRMRYLKSIISLPKSILAMFFAMFSIKRTHKKFINTEHGVMD